MDDAMVQQIFSRQLGLVTTAQARVAGLTERQIEHRLARGWWVSVHRGVHRHGAVPVTEAQLRLAAVLAAGPGAVLSHRAAFAWWGVGGFACHLLEVARAVNHRVRVEGVVVHRRADLGAGGTTVHDGVPVTTPARTLVHVGEVLAHRLVVRGMEEWFASRRLGPADVVRELEIVGTRGRPAAARLRRSLETRVLGTVVPDSVPEGRLVEVLVRHGVPAPTHHVLVTVRSGATYELDWAYVEPRVYLEFDGYGAHLASHDRFDSDRHRQNELTIEGWRPLRFTGATLRRRPARVAAQVRALLDGPAVPRPHHV